MFLADLRQSSGPTSFAKHDVNELVISSWLIFIDTSLLEHCRNDTGGCLRVIEIPDVLVLIDSVYKI
ncbi:UNVERIFIED_CONTAM: hypothetical protein NCL1_22851 [Trichonephila clavipes]